MPKIWINKISNKQELVELSNCYNNYSDLKNFLFNILDKSSLFINIEPNKKIVLKPNWVYQNITESDKLCLTTHPNFILAVLEYVLQLKPISVIIGDSPIQSCNWDKLLSIEFIKAVDTLHAKHGIPINIIDFRNEKLIGKKELHTNIRGANSYVLYDLASVSLLEPLSKQNKNFIVGGYDSRITALNHDRGKHKYLIANEVIEADIVINLPKLKTHQKAGITNGLKNYVGTIGEKAYLAHHSSNLSKGGGDCYPGNNYIRKASEYFREKSDKYKGTLAYHFYHNLSSIIWRLAKKTNYANLNGAWYGNDTVWRMVIDINKILQYGNSEGKLSDKPQRKLITICDAIIAGQGNGPLKPDPLAMGLIAISDTDWLLDCVMATLMDFDINKIPLLKMYEIKLNNTECQIFFEDTLTDKSELLNKVIKTIPPKGWIGNIEI